MKYCSDAIWTIDKGGAQVIQMRDLQAALADCRLHREAFIVANTTYDLVHNCLPAEWLHNPLLIIYGERQANWTHINLLAPY